VDVIEPGIEDVASFQTAIIAYPDEDKLEVRAKDEQGTEEIIINPLREAA
jgi:hypothetical protein